MLGTNDCRLEGSETHLAGCAMSGGLTAFASQVADCFWNEPRYTATGFPRVFYLRYHGFAKFFPLWALARYLNLNSGNMRAVAFGM